LSPFGRSSSIHVPANRIPAWPSSKHS